MYGRALWKLINPLTNWCLRQTNSHPSSSSSSTRPAPESEWMHVSMDSTWHMGTSWKNAPTESGRAPGRPCSQHPKEYRFFSFFLFFFYLAKHWLQHGEPVRGTVYKKKQNKKGFKKKQNMNGEREKKKPFCKHGTINRSNSRFRTMHVMTYIFLWYNFHTSHSHQLQFVVFSF